MDVSHSLPFLYVMSHNLCQTGQNTGDDLMVLIHINGLNTLTSVDVEFKTNTKMVEIKKINSAIGRDFFLSVLKCHRRWPHNRGLRIIMQHNIHLWLDKQCQWCKACHHLLRQIHGRGFDFKTGSESWLGLMQQEAWALNNQMMSPWVVGMVLEMVSALTHDHHRFLNLQRSNQKKISIRSGFRIPGEFGRTY